MFTDTLRKITEQYIYERVKPFSESHLSKTIQTTLRAEAQDLSKSLGFDFKVRASAGQFQTWAAIPWVAFFDPLITTTAQEGYYVFFLINPLEQTASLSMNQGATSVFREFREKQGLRVLQRRAMDIKERLTDYAEHFSDALISLSSLHTLPLGYEAGRAFGRTYEVDELNTDEFKIDLQKMLEAYKVLTFRGGTLPTDTMQEKSGSKDIDETRRYVLSRRIERASNVRRIVLAKRKPICESCGLDPKRDYSYSGHPMQVPLDVHHARPLKGLSEGETFSYSVPDDFLVLCPTCHRMIHKQKDPSDLEQLQSKIHFKFAREGALGLL